LWRFPSLHTLFLQSNLLSSTSGIASIGTLQHVVLDRNRIRCVEIGTLDTCHNLKELHLVANRMTTLEGMDRIKGLVSANVPLASFLPLFLSCCCVS
jgi:hypothetical protein